MSNISQFFKGDTRKKNRKIFAGKQTVVWTAPSQTSEVDVHVWGGGGDGSADPAARHAGGGGGYTSNTFVVGAGTTIGVSVGSTASTSTATITNPVGVSTLTSTGGYPGYNPTPSPNYGKGGSGSYTLHPAEPTTYVFTANGGDSRMVHPSPSYAGNSAGGGGAGFIYGPGGNSGHMPGSFKGFSPSPDFNQPVRAGAGGGGIKGDGGFGVNYGPSGQTSGGGGGGFMPGQINFASPGGRGMSFGGSGIDGSSMGVDAAGNVQTDQTWFYLEDVKGIGGATGWQGNAIGGPPQNYRMVQMAMPGLAGGGGGGTPQPMYGGTGGSMPDTQGGIQAGSGGIFGGGGGGSFSREMKGGHGGYAGGGGGGHHKWDPAGPADVPVDGGVSGRGGEGIIIIYY